MGNRSARELVESRVEVGRGLTAGYSGVIVVFLAKIWDGRLFCAPFRVSNGVWIPAPASVER
jgi:hypothetical protein